MPCQENVPTYPPGLFAQWQPYLCFPDFPLDDVACSSTTPASTPSFERMAEQAKCRWDVLLGVHHDGLGARGVGCLALGSAIYISNLVVQLGWRAGAAREIPCHTQGCPPPQANIAFYWKYQHNVAKVPRCHRGYPPVVGGRSGHHHLNNTLSSIPPAFPLSLPFFLFFFCSFDITVTPAIGSHPVRAITR